MNLDELAVENRDQVDLAVRYATELRPDLRPWAIAWLGSNRFAGYAELLAEQLGLRDLSPTQFYRDMRAAYDRGLVRHELWHWITAGGVMAALVWTRASRPSTRGYCEALAGDIGALVILMHEAWVE